MKKYLSIILLFVASLLQMGLSFAQGTNYEIAFAGNAFELDYSEGQSTVGRQSAHISSASDKVTRVYFKVLGQGELTAKIKGKASSNSAKISVSFLGQEKEASFGAKDAEVNLGSFQLTAPGYIYADIKGLEGDAEVYSFNISGAATAPGVIYSNDPNNYYWSRRGPSCHLAYPISKDEQVQYYYNEVYVPQGQDQIGSYFMAIGFSQGYFGIQVNSESERRILFSVWSPFQTDDPKAIPEDQKIVLNKKGKDVYTGEFGNEGSGGQSFLRYSWKAGQTYKFLLKGVPNGENHTDFTAWFFDPEMQDWRLIASFKRPKIRTYLTGFHSFLENFNPNKGDLDRRVEFKNQWYFADGWKKTNEARFTVDNTYRLNLRIDAIGGRTKDGYYLRNCGFFNEVVQPGTVFQYDNPRPAPIIDFAKLP